jgi:hypothetical protein
MKTEWPIIITNGVCLVLSAFILLMTVLPHAQKEAVAETLDPNGSTKKPASSSEPESTTVYLATRLISFVGRTTP